ncbi:hypothetical protein SAMN04488075_1255 [Paracoccus alkenifer]|uniref:DUF2125 domain-containing protein n=2 Tax=Paracoccus alkenifer TaxID=65735 RepID=A0A1H6L7Y8_9RHOB|nr:hypothetical protein SAMN04488075_1255 [Paracoccus alkenifer]
MRFLSILLLALGVALGFAWLGGESWLAGKARGIIAQDPRISAASVAPLRRLDRIGLHLDNVAVATPQGAAALPTLDLWAAPSSPHRFHAELPPQMLLPIQGDARQVAAQDAELTLQLSPGSGMAVALMAARSGKVSVEGAPLLARLDARALLVPMGAQAPQAARAAYAVEAEWSALTPGAALDLPAALAAQALSGQGTAQVFLTGPLRPGEPKPRLAGIASPGFTLTLGPQSLRVAGQLTADADNRAEGALFLYTTDARAWMQLTGDLGLIPPRLVMLAGSALEQAAGTEPPATTPAPPDSAPGELRIPLTFRDGRMFLGPLPLGEAPRLGR